MMPPLPIKSIEDWKDCKIALMVYLKKLSWRRHLSNARIVIPARQVNGTLLKKNRSHRAALPHRATDSASRQNGRSSDASNGFFRFPDFYHGSGGRDLNGNPAPAPLQTRHPADLKFPPSPKQLLIVIKLLGDFLGIPGPA